ncbi:MAG: type IV pilin, partial [Thermoplasmata archaeon]
MKANRKFVEGEEAVSAVIGVILMVAITVAIAAAVYVYVSGMITGTPGRTPTISCAVHDD